MMEYYFINIPVPFFQMTCSSHFDFVKQPNETNSLLTQIIFAQDTKEEHIMIVI